MRRILLLVLLLGFLFQQNTSAEIHKTISEISRIDLILDNTFDIENTGQQLHISASRQAYTSKHTIKSSLPEFYSLYVGLLNSYPPKLKPLLNHWEMMEKKNIFCLI